MPTVTMTFPSGECADAADATTDVLWIIDSRFRIAINKRYVHIYPLTEAGLLDAWKRVVGEECPDEWENYADIAKLSQEWIEETDVFNDYWAEYGWYMLQASLDPVDEIADDIIIIDHRASAA